MVYGRRLCLRIRSLTNKTKERANVLEQVSELFKEGEVEIPDAVLDWVQKVWKVNNYVIVILTPFRHRLYTLEPQELKKTKYSPWSTKVIFDYSKFHNFFDQNKLFRILVLPI